jgi:hypothetical protein
MVRRRPVLVVEKLEGKMLDRRQGPGGEDVGNVIEMEHVNLTVPDQGMATLFYISGLGGTRDPYLMVGTENMWVNIGEQQFHLPTRGAQVIHGHVGLVVSDLDALIQRLGDVRDGLAGTSFQWEAEDGQVKVTGPWGNHFRCYASGQGFSGMNVGISYVEFLVRPGTTDGIKEFYRRVLRAPASMIRGEKGTAVRVLVGRGQALIFRETVEALRPYDGHHIAVYVADFSGPYRALKRRGLITEEFANHQFRFHDIVNPKTGKKLFQLEHEVRSMRHPMYRRNLVNRDPAQSLGSYVRGRDAFAP